MSFSPPKSVTVCVFVWTNVRLGVIKEKPVYPLSTLEAPEYWLLFREADSLAEQKPMGSKVRARLKKNKEKNNETRDKRLPVSGVASNDGSPVTSTESLWRSSQTFNRAAPSALRATTEYCGISSSVSHCKH